jgi:hypothetical protein
MRYIHLAATLRHIAAKPFLDHSANGASPLLGKLFCTRRHWISTRPVAEVW